MKMDQKIIIDTIVAAPALTLPLWIQSYTAIVQVMIVTITLVAVILRLRIIWREYKGK
jgi:hypothetical protein